MRKKKNKVDAASTPADGCNRAVTNSVDAYRQPKRISRRVFGVGDAHEDLIEAIRNATMDARHNHLDDLLKETP